MKRNKILSFILTAFMIVGLVPGTAIPALGATQITYLDASWNDSSKKVEFTEKYVGEGDETSSAEYTEVTSSENNDEVNWSTGWYVVPAADQPLTIEGYIKVTGDVKLILCDGSRLVGNRGINVAQGNSLKVYAQSSGSGMGVLELKGSASPGLGGRSKAAGSITINGGSITAKGAGSAAGIGGDNGFSGGSITINGGVINAKGGDRGAGIGGGKEANGGEIVINGGTIEEAEGGTNSAGIGGGYHGGAGNIVINGGSVTAKAGGHAGCIGSGSQGGVSGDSITINGGQIKANAQGSSSIAIGDINGDSTITLGWTDKDQDYIEVSDELSWNENGGYVGSVTVDKNFLVYRNGSVIDTIAKGALSDTTIIRNRTIKPMAEYILSTDGNVRVESGQVGSTNKFKIGKNETVNLLPKSGYHFTGDAAVTTASATEVTLTDNSFTMPEENVTAEATVEPNSFKVVYDKNNPDATGTMGEQTFVYDEYKNLLANGFSLTGMTLEKWTTKPDGTGEGYEDCMRARNLTAENNGMVTLYAKWRTANEWDGLQELLDKAASGSTVTLDRDYTATGENASLKIRKNLTLDLNGHIINGDKQVKGLIEPSPGVTFTLKDSNSTAEHVTPVTYHDPVEDVDVIINGGILMGGTHYGIYIQNPGGAENTENVIMDGGTITGCGSESTGVGAVYLNTGNNFTMNGGALVGNRCGLYTNTTFGDMAIINGGIIAGNIKGGVVISSATLTMNGGTIRNNTNTNDAGGVSLYSGEFIMTGGTIEGNKGTFGGLYYSNARKPFVMSGGSIINNTATSRYSDSAGVCISSPGMELSGKVNITGNKNGNGKESNLVVSCTHKHSLTNTSEYVVNITGKLDPESRVGICAYPSNSSPNWTIFLTDGFEKSGNTNPEVFLFDETNPVEGGFKLYGGDLVLTRCDCYNVTFDSDGGSAVASQQILKDTSWSTNFSTEWSRALKPADPKKEGFTFAGWKLNGADYDFNTPLTEDIELKAEWTKETGPSGGSGGKSSGGKSSGGKSSKTGDTTAYTNPTDKDQAAAEAAKKAEEERAATITEKVVESPDGSQCKVKSDGNGKVVAVEANVSSDAAAEAAKAGSPITLSGKVAAADSSKEAAAVTVNLPENSGNVKVKIPVEKLTDSTVAVLVGKDGSTEVVKTSVTENGGITLTLKDSATVKIINNSKSFKDVKGTEWFAKNVEWAASHEVMNGTGDGNFTPNAGTTQAMMEQILYNIDGQKAEKAQKGAPWYAEADTWAKNSGVTATLGKALNPKAGATREVDIMMMFNYAKSKGYNTAARGDLSIFADADRISAEAREAFAWAVAMGIITGTTDKDGNLILDADGIASRVQVAAIVQRFCEKVLV